MVTATPGMVRREHGFHQPDGSHRYTRDHYLTRMLYSQGVPLTSLGVT